MKKKKINPQKNPPPPPPQNAEDNSDHIPQPKRASLEDKIFCMRPKKGPTLKLFTQKYCRHRKWTV